MKQLFRFWIAAALLIVAGCVEEYDDSALVDRVDDLEVRVQKLEQLCQQMNTNISSLQTIVTALQNNDYVTGVTPITENGKTIGYTITFAKAQSITIYHGKDGQNGADGKDGQDGADGKDGYTPIIGVRQDTDGIYYWTLDGEWLRDNAGNRIKALGTDGKDGITPMLKIEDDYWYVSYDNGASWNQFGKATGKDGDSIFHDVRQDENNVYFTLANGTEITIPKVLALSIKFYESDLVVMSPNTTREIGYTVTSATETVKVEVTSSADIKAKVVADDANGMTGKIHITTGDGIDEYSKVIVFVSNGDKVIMRSITFEEAGLIVEENTTKQATAAGGEVTLEFLSNVECEVVIPEEAQRWISVVPATRTMEKETITLKLRSNQRYYRSATVTVQSLDMTLKLEYHIEQNGEFEIEKIDPTQIPDNEIWYRTTDGEIYDPFRHTTNPFDVEIISNSFEQGVWKIKCAKPIKTVNTRTFYGTRLLEIYLPQTIEYLAASAICETSITELNIPISLQYVSGAHSVSPIYRNFQLKKLTGAHVSEDGKCLVLNKTLENFIGLGIEEYTIPSNVTSIATYSFFYDEYLKKLIIPEGVERIEFSAIQSYNESYPNGISGNLEYVSLPSSLEYIGGYIFNFTNTIKKFLGNCRFISSDGYSLVVDNYLNTARKTLTNFAAGAGLESYTIPEGVESIENYAFYHANELKELFFPSTLKHIESAAAFEGAYNIERIYGPNVLSDNKSLVIDGTLTYVAPKGLKKYTTPPGVTKLSYGVLSEKFDLEEVIISDDVITVGSATSCRPYEIPLGYILHGNPNLKTVTISANIRILGKDPFGVRGSGEDNYGAYDFIPENLESVYLRTIIPPTIGHNWPNKIPTLFGDMIIYVPLESLQAYLNSPDWAPYKGYIKGYKYIDLPENETYISTDYSQDGVLTTLQTATVGKGIDVVLMGDAYSDRQIADGTYKNDMEYIYNNLFTEEPYKSFKDYFNVHYVNVVSATEGYEYVNTALDTFFGDGTYVGGSDNACFEYALNAVSENDMDEALIIVAMNSDNYAGTCYMYYPTYTTGTYGSGPSVAYFPRGGDATTFAQLLHHEACGHGFAKLADEYAYEYMGTIPEAGVNKHFDQQSNWGWWKNVDFTSNPTATRWSHFISDTRYANEGLGAYEGGLTYWTGVWRPTENSIMRYNTGGFNAPSREAIYYRIHKLAYGDSWEYDYEKFVEWDARNRATAATRAMVYKPANYKPTHPPVIVNKSWRDAK